MRKYRNLNFEVKNSNSFRVQKQSSGSHFICFLWLFVKAFPVSIKDHKCVFQGLALAKEENIWVHGH